MTGRSPATLTQRHGWWWCAAAAVLFGASTPATKFLVDDIGAMSLAGLLYLGAAIGVAPFVERRGARHVQRSQRIRLMTAVALGGGVAPVLLVLALDRTPASTVSLLLNLELVATVLIARLFLHEQIGRRAALGITAVAASGVVLAGGPDAAWAGGALLVAGACLCWGVDNAITASLDAWSPARITLVKGVVAGTVNLAIGMAIAGVPDGGAALAALAVGAIGYGLSITMWITGARQLGAARGQVVFALAPFIGAALSWAVHDDDLGATFAIAFAMSLTGVLIVATSRHGHEHHHVRLEHAHPIDPTDPHHAPDAIEVLGEQRHRHLELTHTHEHLPDLHHRHDH